MMLPVLLTALAGIVAGGLGALLGLGGGVLLVPFLNLAIGLPIHAAFAVSLITVIATSSMTSAGRVRMGLVNLRLGMVLEIFTTTGGLTGIFFVNHASDRILLLVFAATLVFIAIVTVSRLSQRNVTTDSAIDVGLLGGRYHEPESGCEVAYRVKRVPVAFGASFLAGFVSLLGLGGGVLKVPALNAWCGVPIRVAAATSGLMIGATAEVGSINYLVHGQVIPHLAAAAALGVLAGSRVGLRIGARSTAKGLKLLMAVVLLAVAASYVVRVGR
jgi:uncharacterized membrane protein YfcA